MLDAFVIEEIKRRERERGHEDRPAIELPVPPPPPSRSDVEKDETPPGDRGVVIIDYSSSSSTTPGERPRSWPMRP